jgi:hypothetical protein
MSLVWPVSAMAQRASGSLATPVGRSSPDASSRLRPTGWSGPGPSAAAVPTPESRRSAPLAALAWGAAIIRHGQPVGGHRQGDGVLHQRDQPGLDPARPGGGVRCQGDDRCRGSVERRPAVEGNEQGAVRAKGQSGRNPLAVAAAERTRGEVWNVGSDRDLASPVDVHDVVGRSVADVPTLAAIGDDVVGVARQLVAGLERLQVDRQTAGAAQAANPAFGAVASPMAAQTVPRRPWPPRLGRKGRRGPARCRGSTAGPA